MPLRLYRTRFCAGLLVHLTLVLGESLSKCAIQDSRLKPLCPAFSIIVVSPVSRLWSKNGRTLPCKRRPPQEIKKVMPKEPTVTYCNYILIRQYQRIVSPTCCHKRHLGAISYQLGGTSMLPQKVPLKSTSGVKDATRSKGHRY